MNAHINKINTNPYYEIIEIAHPNANCHYNSLLLIPAVPQCNCDNTNLTNIPQINNSQTIALTAQNTSIHNESSTQKNSTASTVTSRLSASEIKIFNKFISKEDITNIDKDRKKLDYSEIEEFFRQSDMAIDGPFNKVTSSSQDKFTQDSTTMLNIKPVIKLKHGSAIGWCNEMYKCTASGIPKPKPIIIIKNYNDIPEAIKLISDIEESKIRKDFNRVGQEYDIIIDSDAIIDGPTDTLMYQFYLIDFILSEQSKYIGKDHKCKFKGMSKLKKHYIDASQWKKNVKRNNKQELENLTSEKKQSVINYFSTPEQRKLANEILNNILNNKSDEIWNRAKTISNYIEKLISKNSIYKSIDGNNIDPNSFIGMLVSQNAGTYNNFAETANNINAKIKNVVVDKFTEFGNHNETIENSENKPFITVHCSVSDISFEENSKYKSKSKTSKNIPILANNQKLDTDPYDIDLVFED